jgi:hypothetical protein
LGAGGVLGPAKYNLILIVSGAGDLWLAPDPANGARTCLALAKFGAPVMIIEARRGADLGRRRSTWRLLEEGVRFEQARV